LGQVGEMTLKEKYQIGDATWRKLKFIFLHVTVNFSLIFIPVAGGVVALLDGDFSWIPVTAILWFYPLLFVVPFWQLWFVRSKYTNIVILLYIIESGFIFIILSSASVFRLFGSSALLIQNILLIAYVVLSFPYFFKYWTKVWDSHKYHNENVALDLVNGRFDLLNNFDHSENKIGKYSNPALVNIALAISPVGGAITLLLTKHGDRTTPIIIVWLLSIPVILWGYKLVVGSFVDIIKLSHYEKLIGKPIINGLLTEKDSTSCAHKRAPKAKKKYGSNKT